MELEVLDLSTLEPGYSSDPYPIYAQLRRSAPIRRVLLHGLPAWLVTRFDDAEGILTDPRVSNDPAHASQAVKDAAPWVFANTLVGLSRMMLQVDPPDHTRLRRLVSKVFTPRRIEALRPRIEEITQDLLAAFAPRGQVELIEEFATPLPVTVIMELLGIPPGDQHDFLRWSTTVLSGVEDPQIALDAFISIQRYLSDLVDRKYRDDAPMAEDAMRATDLLTALVGVRYEDDPRLDEQELLSMAFLLLIAGFTTTTNLIGNGVLTLLRHPDQLAALRSDPSLIDAAVEELLRYEGPTELTAPRFAAADIMVGDVTISAGEAILVALGSADRDRSQFTDPDRLDLSRDSHRHLAFGYGVHYCLGAPLARLEGRIGLQAILSLEHLALATDPEKLEWAQDPHIRGVRHLPLSFTPVA